MTEEINTKQITIGIIGGGQGGQEMLKIFSDCDSVHVTYLVDRDTEAPGVVEAKKRKIKVLDDLQEALLRHAPDFIIEATGSEKVEQTILENLPNNSEMVSSSASLMFFNILAENRKKANLDAYHQIREIGEEIAASAKSVQGTLNGINEVAFSLDMLSVNASVEAARAGVKGRSFAVVADAVKDTAKEAKILVGDIEAVTSNNMRMSQQLKDLLADLG